MSFKEGFSAIETIQSSGRKLGDTVARIEALETKLVSLLQAQAQLESLIERIQEVLVSLKASSGDLSTEYANLTGQAQALPEILAEVLVRAEQRAEERQAKTAELVADLPRLVDTALEQKMTSLLSGMETRLRDQLRGELKDTRTAIRDILEVNLRNQEKSLDVMTENIIAEMPRGLLGRRGKH